jgi:hypothetical protein
MQCPRCQQENRPVAKSCDQCGTPLQHPPGSTEPLPSYGALQRSLTEALGHQTAAADVLRVIRSSPADAQPAFDMIARNATILTGASVCNVFRFDGEQLFLVAHHNFSPEAVAFLSRA